MKAKIISALSYILLSLSTAIMILPLIILITRAFLSPNKPAAVGFVSNMIFSVSLEQFKVLFLGNEEFFYLCFRSFGISILIVFFQILLALPLALLMGLFKFRGRLFILSLYIFVQFLPAAATILPNYITLRGLGLLNTHAAIIIPSIFSPLGALVLTPYVLSIPRDTVEASLLETNDLFVVFKNIILPQISSGLSLLFIISFTETWNMVEAPQAFLENPLLHPLSLSLNSIFKTDAVINHAGVLMYLLPPVLLLLCINSFFEINIHIYPARIK